MKLLPIESLHVHEATDPGHVQEITAMIVAAGVFTEPVIVDKKTLVVLDGHHRVQSCKELGAVTIPCMLVRYLRNAAIAVYPRRKDIPVSKKAVIAMGMSNNTFPVKTTRHSIPKRETGLCISLSSLGIVSDSIVRGGTPFWKNTGDPAHGSVAISYAAGEDVVLDAQLIPYECDVNMAHVCMMVKSQYIPVPIGVMLLEGLRSIKQDYTKGRYHLHPSLEDVHSNIEHVLITNYGIEVGGYLRLGIARNDQVYTDTRMWMRDHMLGLCDMLCILIDVLVQKAIVHTKTIMPGYTHLRISQPITFGHWLVAKAFHILDDLMAILNMFDHINMCPLGIFEMAGTHLRIDRAYTARLLGFSQASVHSLYTANQRGELEAKLLHEFVMLAMHIRRTMNELVVFSGHEFQLFTLGSAYTTGGTAQPNLTNPDTLEVVRANMARITAASLETVMIMDTLPSGFNRDTQVTKKILFDACKLMESTVPVVAGIFSTLEPNKKRMEELANANFAVAPDMTIQLSVCGSVSFREAYMVVKALISKRSVSSFTQLTPQIVADVALEVLGKPIVITQEQLGAVASARASVYAHTSAGGPAPGQVKHMIKKVQKELLGIKTKIQEKKQRCTDASQILERTVTRVSHDSHALNSKEQ